MSEHLLWHSRPEALKKTDDSQLLRERVGLPSVRFLAYAINYDPAILLGGSGSQVGFFRVRKPRLVKKLKRCERAWLADLLQSAQESRQDHTATFSGLCSWCTTLLIEMNS